MIAFQLSQLAAELGGVVEGSDVEIASVSTDTRTLEAGDLYVALVGDRFDGHDYLQEAADKQAGAALVSKDVVPLLPLLKVADTRLGLGELAAYWRQQASAKLVGVTGSNGKTTVKEMIASILRQQGSVLATRGNLNNDIGLPITLTRLQDQDYAVIEMGANHAGEIGYLSNIARPDVAVLNNAGRAHLEGFGSVEGVARAKAEIFNGLGEHGICVFNADDDYADLWRASCAGKTSISFGCSESAMVRADSGNLALHWSDTGFRSNFEVQSPAGSFTVSLQLAGRHNQMNALAAVAACMALDVDTASIQAGLAAVAPVPGRLCLLHGCNESWLIDDSYNANPDSVSAAIEVLAAAPGSRILVLGDLGELGETELALHAEIGRAALAGGVQRLFTCGQLSEAASSSFGNNGQHFADMEALVAALKRIVLAGDTVLVKGSRAAGMDRVVKALTREETAC